MPEDSPGVAAQTAKWTVKAQWSTQSCRAQTPGCQPGLAAPSSSVRARLAAGVPPATQSTHPTPVSWKATSPAERLQSSRRGSRRPHNMHHTPLRGSGPGAALQSSRQHSRSTSRTRQSPCQRISTEGAAALQAQATSPVLGRESVGSPGGPQRMAGPARMVMQAVAGRATPAPE